MTELRGKTALLTGGTRGIGRAIALKLAAAGVHCALAAKTDTPHPQLPGTLDSVCDELRAAGTQAIGIKTDVREHEQIANAVATTVQHFGRLDIVIHNAGAIQLNTLENTPLRQYDLMQSVNERALFLLAQYSLPHLKRAEHPHLLALSPPLNLNPAWLGKFIPYTLSKYGMSLLIAGLAEELKDTPVACNSLWPRTYIATAATERFAGSAIYPISRTPEIMADAVMALLHMPTPPRGQHLLDETLLRSQGISDLEKYSWEKGNTPQLDFYIDA